MEEFLRSYVQAIAKDRDTELYEEEMDRVVHNLMSSEVIWDVLEEHVNYELDEIGVN